MKFHVLKLNFDNGELVRLYANEEDINKKILRSAYIM